MSKGRWLVVVWCWCLALSTAAAAVTATATASGAAEVRFDIDLREEIAAGRFDPQRGDRLSLRGGWLPLRWHTPLWLKADAPSGLWSTTVHFLRKPHGDQPIAYKLRIERAGQGPDEGWESGPNRALALSAQPLVVQRSFNAPPQPQQPRRTGHIESLGQIDSRHVEPRAVQVWLPPGYHEPANRRWPVLYLHDGQNVFDARAAGAEWMVDETAQRLAMAGRIDAPIIVAVDSTRRRADDYTPTRITLPAERTGTGQAQTLGGQAPAYARFLIDELKPLIDARYRTLSGPQHTAVGGSSLGGLVSLWLALEHPRHFGAAWVVSPSLWWDDGWPLRTVLALPDAAPASSSTGTVPRLWLDMGAQEGPGAIEAARNLRDALMSRGWRAATLAASGGQAGEARAGAESSARISAESAPASALTHSPTLAYTEDAEGGHDELSWAGRVEAMLIFLYGRGAPTPAR